MNLPLAGVRVLELGGIGPGPHAAVLLAQLGADVTRIERPRHAGLLLSDATRKHLFDGLESVPADLRDDVERERVLRLVERADILIEGFRPGVVERLGIGPEACQELNPELIYIRVTGWGQGGPRAHTAGHDINYLALTGILNAIGSPDGPPQPPLNLLGDQGGGSLYVVAGALAALHARTTTRKGQLVDAAIVDGTSSLAQPIWALRSSGQWSDARGTNVVDGGAPYYGTYRCADDRYVAVGAIEDPFYLQLIDGLGLTAEELPDRHNKDSWPHLRAQFAATFAARSRDEWDQVFADTDACVTPVLTFEEATRDRHLAARRTLVKGVDGSITAGTAPRFSD